MSDFDRRKFLGLTGSAAAVAMLEGVLGKPRAPRPIGRQVNDNPVNAGSSLLDLAAPQDRTLIVIDMEGGNDALNTFVPPSGTYHDLRPTLGLSEDELLRFAGLDYGVNPGLGDLQRLWETDRIAAAYGVGMAEQTRSHFVAQDAWRSAQPGTAPTSGWLGRWLELTEPDQEVPLRAISLGRSTLAAQGETGRPVAIQSVDGYRLAPPRGNEAVTEAVLAMAQSVGSGLLGDAQRAIPTTVESVDLLQGLIADTGAGDDDFGPDLTSALFAVAEAVIQADVGTQVLYLTVPGFDTHASQRVLQADLLRSVATGLDSVFAALEETGRSDRVMALTVSEFGRRAEENASNGTDHGNGGLALLAGPAVNGGSVSGAALVDDLDDGDLPVVIDTRAMYANALRFLGTGDDIVGQVLGDDWEPLDLLRGV